MPLSLDKSGTVSLLPPEAWYCSFGHNVPGSLLCAVYILLTCCEGTRYQCKVSNSYQQTCWPRLSVPRQREELAPFCSSAMERRVSAYTLLFFGVRLLLTALWMTLCWLLSGHDSYFAQKLAKLFCLHWHLVSLLPSFLSLSSPSLDEFHCWRQHPNWVSSYHNTAPGTSPHSPPQQPLLTTCLRHKNLSCLIRDAVFSSDHWVDIRSSESRAPLTYWSSRTTKILQDNFISGVCWNTMGVQCYKSSFYTFQLCFSMGEVVSVICCNLLTYIK